MNPKQFLMVGGIVLVVLGILGFIQVLGPTADTSIFGSAWWFDNGENWAHLLIGIVGVVAAYVLPASGQKTLVMVLGVVGVLVGLYSLFISQVFLGAHLERVMDTLLHLAVGVWALYASMGKQGQMMGQM